MLYLFPGQPFATISTSHHLQDIIQFRSLSSCPRGSVSLAQAILTIPKPPTERPTTNIHVHPPNPNCSSTAEHKIPLRLPLLARHLHRLLLHLPPTQRSHLRPHPNSTLPRPLLRLPQHPDYHEPLLRAPRGYLRSDSEGETTFRADSRTGA